MRYYHKVNFIGLLLFDVGKKTESSKHINNFNLICQNFCVSYNINSFQSFPGCWSHMRIQLFYFQLIFFPCSWKHFKIYHINHLVNFLQVFFYLALALFLVSLFTIALSSFYMTFIVWTKGKFPHLWVYNGFLC